MRATRLLLGLAILRLTKISSRSCSEDESDPNEPYDVSWVDEIMVKDVNRNIIQMWFDVVIVHAAPDLPPVGIDEAVLEQNASQEDRYKSPMIGDKDINPLWGLPDREGAPQKDTVEAGSAPQTSVATCQTDKQSTVDSSGEIISPTLYQDAGMPTNICQPANTQTKQNITRGRDDKNIDSHDGRSNEEQERQEQSNDEQPNKSCHRIAFISQSEPAYGRKRRRIVTWAGKVRKGYY
jgi:hypothetical protein